MAATYAHIEPITNRPQRVGQLLHRYQKATLDNSYPTGGYAYTATNAGMTKLLGLLFFNGAASDATHGYVAIYNPTTGKIMLYWTAAAAKGALAEVDNATDVSAVVLNFIAVGL